jgi:hypothetical protein
MMQFETGTMRFETGVAEQWLEMGAAAQGEMLRVRGVFSTKTGQGRSLSGCILFEMGRSQPVPGALYPKVEPFLNAQPL